MFKKVIVISFFILIGSQLILEREDSHEWRRFCEEKKIKQVFDGVFYKKRLIEEIGEPSYVRLENGDEILVYKPGPLFYFFGRRIEAISDSSGMLREMSAKNPVSFYSHLWGE